MLRTKAPRQRNRSSSRRTPVEELAMEVVRAAAVVAEPVERHDNEHALLYVRLQAHFLEAEVERGGERARLFPVELEREELRIDRSPVARLGLAASVAVHGHAAVARRLANDALDAAARVRVAPVASQHGEVECGRRFVIDCGHAASSIRKNSRVNRFASQPGSRNVTNVATTRRPRLRFACSSTETEGSS